MLTLRGVLANVASCIDLDQEGGRHTNAHDILHPRELLLVHDGGVDIQSQAQPTTSRKDRVEGGETKGESLSLSAHCSKVIDCFEPSLRAGRSA